MNFGSITRPLLPYTQRIYAKLLYLKKNFFADMCAYFCFIIFYLVAYGDVLFQQTLFLALNLSPLPTSNARFYVPGQFYWFPGNLGSLAQSHLAPWLPYILVQLTGNNLVLAEKFLASATLVSCFTMYFFLSNHFKGSRLAIFSAALIYGFGPATVLNFADVLNWGYAMLPLVFNYMFNLLEGRRKVSDILLLGLSLSILTAFLPQILLFILISLVIFIAIRTIPIVEKRKYLRKIVFSFSLSILVFILTSPYLISGTYRLMATIGWIPSSVFSQPTLPSPFQPALYSITYANQEIANTIRLIGGSPGNYLPISSWIGFVLPIVAFASLLLVRRGKKMLNLLAFALISLIIITIIFGIHLKAGWALWLLYNTPISLLYYPERALYVVTFVYAVLVSVTIAKLIDAVTVFSGSKFFARRIHFISRHNLRFILSVFSVLSILISVFMFAPVFNQQLHQERYQPLPRFYSDIQNWLNSLNNGENYRVMFLPTDSFSSTIGTPDVFECTAGYAFSQTNNYVNFVYNQFVTGETHNLGSMLAFASVKYIILTNSTSDTLKPDLMGPVRYTAGFIYGNSVGLQKLLDAQNDLKLVYIANNFRVYENVMYLPKVSVFSNATYIVGSDSALSTLHNLPGFNITTNMLIFGSQNPSLAKELSAASSSVLFFNSDVSDHARLLHLSTTAAADVISIKDQVYLFSQNASSFSLSVTISSGQWRLALELPAPVTLNPNVPVTLNPNMTVINLDQRQFVLTKENFKSVHNFDLADYYFYTREGGHYSITIEGSGALGAYLAYNTTVLNIATAQFTYVDLPDNGTFTIDLPPGALFEPLVQIYSPVTGYNVKDNVDKITLERVDAIQTSEVVIDDITISKAEISEANGWYVFGPLNLTSGTHNIHVSNGLTGGYFALYNTANLSQIFNNASINYKSSKYSETSYGLNVNVDVPIFFSLSESYYPNWLAYSNTRNLIHFVAFSYSNGFYLNTTGSTTVTVNYDPPVLNQIYVSQQILLVAIVLFLIILPIAKMMHKSIMRQKRDETYNAK